MSEPKRIVVPGYDFRLAEFDRPVSHDAQGTTVDVRLQKYAAQVVRDMTPEEAAREAEDLDLLGMDIASNLRHDLGAAIGFIPHEVTYSTEDEPYRVEFKPRWWEVLRLLGLRPRRGKIRIRRYHRAWCVAGTYPGYEIERAKP